MVESIAANRSPNPAWAGTGAKSAMQRTRLIALRVFLLPGFFIDLLPEPSPAALARGARFRRPHRFAPPAALQGLLCLADIVRPTSDSARTPELRRASSSTRRDTSARVGRWS